MCANEKNKDYKGDQEETFDIDEFYAKYWF